MDRCILQFILQCRRNDKIVDPPSCVLLTRLEAVGPPGIASFLIRIKIAECIDKSTLKNLCKACSLLVCKAGILTVCLRILEVDLLMCNIQIAAADDRLLLLKPEKIRKSLSHSIRYSSRLSSLCEFGVYTVTK